MKENATETKADREIESPALKKVAKIGRGVVGFLGAAGSSYYRKYEELKRR